MKFFFFFLRNRSQKKKINVMGANGKIFEHCQTLKVAIVVLVAKSHPTLATLWTVAHHWSSCHFLLQGKFLTYGWNLHLFHWQACSLPLSHLGSSKEQFSKAVQEHMCMWAVITLLLVAKGWCWWNLVNISNKIMTEDKYAHFLAISGPLQKKMLKLLTNLPNSVSYHPSES